MIKDSKITDKEILSVNVNGVDFYCEKRGQGPAILLVPDGCNDCEPYDNLSKLLSDEFTVLNFDMRGTTRSVDSNPQRLTAKMLGDDLAGLIEALDLGPASVYGCSSGGQATLALGKYHPNLVRNLMVHEAALQADVPRENAGFSFFQNNAAFEPVFKGPVSVGEIWAVGNYEKAMLLSPECRKRIAESRDFWMKCYVGSVDMSSYSKEDFEVMPPTSFTVGTWTPSWLVYANIETAKRGNCPVKWLNCAHHAERVCAEELSEHIRSTCKKYL